MIPILRSLPILLLALVPLAAHAADCELTPPDLSFGNYDPADLLPADESALLSLNCHSDSGSSETVSYSISIGTGSSGSYGPRELAGPGDRLRYNLYTDDNRSLVWGDGSGGSQTVDGMLEPPGNGTAVHPIFGRLEAGQNVAAGTYADQLTIQVVY